MKTPEERRLYDKQYRLDHIEHIKQRTHNYYIKNRDKALEYRKIYYENNKELVLQKHKETYTCECGKVITKNHKARHCETSFHIKTLANKNT